MTPSALDLAAIRAAHARIGPHVRRTPVLANDELNAAAGASIFFKCENLQQVGAFKARGATNAVFALDAAVAARGVCTHSSGNHGAALARAARLRGIPATIVMPHNAPAVKVRNVESFGARVVLCAPTQLARESACDDIVRTTGATLIHPFTNFAVMAGQGTAALELLEEIPALDLVLCPVGGGGLLCGTATVVKTLRPAARVVAVEPLGADDAAQSFRAGKIVPAERVDTIADGLRTTIGDENFAIIRERVDDVVTVTETEIVAAMRALWENLRVIVEPSGAVPFAAIQAGRVAVENLRVGVILSGGNVDLDALPWLKK
ncbi:MAG: L-threonine dehydratase catabolic TdcB [Verrucomicrobiota bacterium]|jgi:threonine dehydratase